MKRFLLFLSLSSINLVYQSEAYLQCYTHSRSTLYHLKQSSSKLYATSDEERKAEISQKIKDLKKIGKIAPNNDNDSESSTTSNIFQDLKSQESVYDQYSTQLSEKLGRKARYLGIDSGKKKKGGTTDPEQRKGQIGSIIDDNNDEYDILDSELSDEDYDALIDDLADEEEEDDEEFMLEIVAEKMKKKREAERAVEKEKVDQKMKELREQMRIESEIKGNNAPRTSGVGGASAGKNETAMQETRRPSRGSWGVFDRPDDISKAYGGGRRVGAGYMSDADRKASWDRTTEKLNEYKKRVGIDSESEKQHAAEIEDAMKIAELAMARGIYDTAVSALEKVTVYCSSNSKVGSKVFLELGMAYEAVGRAEEATQVYTKLSTCGVDNIRNNAKRLLFNSQSFLFMKNEAKDASFNRKVAAATFTETGFEYGDNIDDKYNTAYIDTDSAEYKKLTENVVRSVREAREIILKAVDSGIVERPKIVQALRSLNRGFNDAIRQEKAKKELEKNQVAIIDGVPIVSTPPESVTTVLEFKLASSEVMLESLSGEWRLQLIADKSGSDVKFYNNTLSWLQLDTNEMQFSREGQVGILPFSETGGLDFDGDNRILRRKEIEASGGGSILAGILGQQDGASCSKVAQTIMTVDSIVMITKCAESLRWKDEEKEHFAVWRRVEPGTFSSSS